MRSHWILAVGLFSSQQLVAVQVNDLESVATMSSNYYSELEFAFAANDNSGAGLAENVKDGKLDSLPNFPGEKPSKVAHTKS